MPRPLLLATALALSITATARSSSARDLTHRVESGQYLVLIAKRYHTTAEAIREHNGLKKKQTLRPGMTLRIEETPEHRKWREFLDERDERAQRKKAARKKREQAKRQQAKRQQAKRQQAKRQQREAKREKAKRQQREKLKREKVVRAKREQAMREKAVRAQREKAVRAQREKAVRAQREKAVRAQREKAVRAQREKAVGVQREKAKGVQRDEALRAQPNETRQQGAQGVVAPRGVEPSQRAQPPVARSTGKSRAPERAAPSAAKPDPVVTLRRHGRTLRLRLLHEGRVDEAAAHRVDHLLRSLHTGETKPFDRGLLLRLATLSDHFHGRTVEIISGFRPGGDQPSRHQLGRAIDLQIAGVKPLLVFEACKALEATGCGFYPQSGFVHIDARSTSRSWIDAAAPGEPPRYVSEWPEKRSQPPKRGR